MVVFQLVDMGFAVEGCKKAVFHTNNTGVEPAMNWVMEHMGDPGNKRIKIFSLHVMTVTDSILITIDLFKKGKYSTITMKIMHISFLVALLDNSSLRTLECLVFGSYKS